MKRFWFIGLVVGLLVSAPGYCLPPLQLFIDLTPAGGTLRLPPGTYAGQAVIKRPITLDGGGQVTIDGEGSGTVLTVRANGATVRGLHLSNSGNSHNKVDAGLLLEADDTLIEENVIDDVLFGIHIKQANGNTVRKNRISSRPNEPSLRGEGVRMWYSRNNLIADNEIEGVRDLLFANSPGNRIIGNSISRSRIGMEFIFSPDSEVRDNRISANMKGLVVLYSNGVVIRGNRLEHMRDFTASAFSIKGSSQVVFEENEVLHCAVGVLANSPTHPENVFHLRNNRFAYNDVAMYFYGEKGGHIISGNRFEENLTQIAVSAPTSARANDWRGNYWDDYKGFDRDHDGTGDTPHSIYVYSDRLWMDRPMTRFFRRSFVLELIDFVERLAPFSEPALILSDPAPRMH